MLSCRNKTNKYQLLVTAQRVQKNSQYLKLRTDQRGGPKMAEEWDGETTFSPTNSSKDHLNAEQEQSSIERLKTQVLS